MLVPLTVSKILGNRKFVYVNPDYVESVHHNDKTGGSMVYMSGSEFPVDVVDNADVVYGMFEYYALYQEGMEEDTLCEQ